MKLEDFDPEKLLENAVTSIRLGIEDFVSSQVEGGDEGRALSSVRNIFAGLALLFKYGLVKAAKDAVEGSKLIFDANASSPRLTNEGEVSWAPTNYRQTTIGLDVIQARFKAVGLHADWQAVNALREVRNNIEHLYAQAGAAAIGQFVAGVYPVLRAFITEELKLSPLELLGPTWETMLQHAQFHAQRQQACEAAWASAPPPGQMAAVLKQAVCANCGSSLLRPTTEVTTSDWYREVRHSCERCEDEGNTIELLEDTLEQMEGGYDPFQGEEAPTGTCPTCSWRAFVHSKGRCLCCGYKLSYTECAVCGEGLGLEEQQYRGLCSYHAYVADRERDR